MAPLMNQAMTSTVGCRVVDRGHPVAFSVNGASGTLMSQWASNYGSMAVIYSPTLCFVAWGRNNASAGGSAIAAAGTDLITGTMGLWATIPTCRVVVVGAMNNGELWPQGAGSLDANIDAVNVAIQSACNTLSASGTITYIDPRPWWFATIPLYNPSNLPGTDFLTVDGLHLNALGASLAAANLMTFRA
jgi:hypothetical protein